VDYIGAIVTYKWFQVETRWYRWVS